VTQCRTQFDEIKAHPIEKLKAELLAKGISRKRVNDVLACLGKMLRYAHEIELLDSVPRIRLLKIAPQKFDFLTFDEYLRLIEATKADRERQAIVLVGGDAGLRQGEMIALEWGDVDLVAGVLTVRRSAWRGIVGAPKSGRERKIPLTARLAAVLKAHRHLRSDRVLCRSDGSPLTQSAIEAVALRRQVPLAERYIVDFLAPSARLVVEVDGASHLARAGSDARRDRVLAKLGYRVLRLQASFVLREPAAAIARIQAALVGD
jgi:very-short-patch-repair endonuclease